MEQKPALGVGRCLDAFGRGAELGGCFFLFLRDRSLSRSLPRTCMLANAASHPCVCTAVLNGSPLRLGLYLVGDLAWSIHVWYAHGSARKASFSSWFNCITSSPETLFARAVVEAVNRRLLTARFEWPRILYFLYRLCSSEANCGGCGFPSCLFAILGMWFLRKHLLIAKCVLRFYHHHFCGDVHEGCYLIQLEEPI
eukprot:4817128-Pleurochrysis_carterae.AAC.1